MLKTWYQKNKVRILAEKKHKWRHDPAFKAQHQKNAQKHVERLKVFIESLKVERPCVDCGIIYPPFVMDFDHVRGKKKFSLGRAAHDRRSREQILLEAAKCEIVCSNCHRIRTYGK